MIGLPQAKLSASGELLSALGVKRVDSCSGESKSTGIRFSMFCLKIHVHIWMWNSCREIFTVFIAKGRQESQESLFIYMYMYTLASGAKTVTSGVMNFRNKVEAFMDIIIMHSVYLFLLWKQIHNRYEDFLRLNKFSLYGHIGPTKGPKPLTNGLWISQFR